MKGKEVENRMPGLICSRCGRVENRIAGRTEKKAMSRERVSRRQKDISRLQRENKRFVKDRIRRRNSGRKSGS
ncbi:MAG: hypothetical protein A4E70_00802 [Syntrophus sp. PtaU1.Bin005]|uniref:hypothetical protein n=1 Tax=Syntrophus TaxID=43773 RepID=UPI0009C45FBB|nr:MAG: hypothetical protein A4E69_00776 [Syntrophus sp. PtaB.Bin138]OPY82255.1 MAG: hypothetical protein A4E70_00802 [Syntrophus sp. PtaU1.Bin005]